MVYENIGFTEPHLTIVGGYFCMFDNTIGMFARKTNDGDFAFTYPTLTPIGYDVKSLEYDGTYFWTLQRGPIDGYDITIKKWKVEDNFCDKVSEIDFVGDSFHRYKSECFTVECYNTSFYTTISGGNSFVSLSEYATTEIDPGDILHLGPNSDGKEEDVTVTGTIDDHVVGLNFFTTYTYEDGDPINTTKAIWLFNDYSGTANTGALYKFDATGNYLEHTQDDEYKSIRSCTFDKITEIPDTGTIHALLYVKNNNIKFISPADKVLYCYMTIDNIRANNVTNINVYDITVYGGCVYRLQIRSMYFEADYAWSTYNYVMSPLRPFVDSISIDAYPLILPSNGVNTTDVTAMVHDQYAQPIPFKFVHFTDTDIDTYGGFIASTPVFTWTDGVAKTTYTAGISPLTVNIEATATQND